MEAEAVAGCIHLISGANGSGKSTLIKLLSSALEPVSGKIEWKFNGQVLPPEQVWKEISLVAPYQELPEEFSAAELALMQQQFSGRTSGLEQYEEVASYFGISSFMQKPIRHLSTGTRQKVRFVLAFGGGRRIWLLDEPGSNLDAESCLLLHQYLQNAAADKLLILASNDAAELALGPEWIAL
jgi:ABC-type multidrug transport system ATPase subunit